MLFQGFRNLKDDGTADDGRTDPNIKEAEVGIAGTLSGHGLKNRTVVAKDDFELVMQNEALNKNLTLFQGAIPFLQSLDKPKCRHFSLFRCRETKQNNF